MFELFTPDTTIFFSFTGIDDFNKTVHDKVPDFVSWARGRMKGQEMTNCSFQRIDQNYTVHVPQTNINYELLMFCDTVVLYNGAWSTQQWVGIIDQVIWVNPGRYDVAFHIDWYTSMLGSVDYEQTYAYIERTHVKNDWQPGGKVPNFGNMGCDEGFGCTPDTPIKTYNRTFDFTNAQVMVYTPYDDDAKPNFNGKMENGMYTAMFQKIMTVQECNAYLQKIAESDEADLGNIASIVSIPKEFTIGPHNEKWSYLPPWLDHAPNVPEWRNAKCWSSEFCIIKLMSGTGQSININPQWLGSNTLEWDVDVNIFFNNGDGGCVFSVINKNDTYDSHTYADFSVTLNGLPQSPWVGNAYAQWKAANMTGLNLQNIGALIGIVAGYANKTISEPNMSTAQTMVGLAGAIGDVAAQTGSIVRQIGNAKTSGTVLGGSSNTDINSAVALGKYGLQVIYYMVQQYIMWSVDDYFDRFGYKVNRLKLLDRKVRPRWTYIKTHEVHLQTDTGISMTARNYIQNILNHGVTFWMDPNRIGDYSDPAGNKEG